MNDIMSDGGGDFYHIDQKRNQYYDHSNSGCEMDLKKSAFLEPTEEDQQKRIFKWQPRSSKSWISLISKKLTRWKPQYKHQKIN